MMQLRRSEERGHADHGWLDSYHTFSFADYYDPGFMGFRDLRVINEDRIDGGTGFPTHPHRDMEIITYIIEGELAHKDSTGTVATIKPGEVQRMSAGTGIQHSEFNALNDAKTHLLQIWIQPDKRGVSPSYEQKDFSLRLAEGSGLTLAVSRDGRDGSVKIHQDVDLYAARWSRPNELNFSLREGRYAWVQLVSGALEINETLLRPGDGVAIGAEKMLRLKTASTAEFLLFDLV
jgi:redox-sensitive bicupin YhaK (pirin superfamily)